MRLHYNAPVTLTFSLLCITILLLDQFLAPKLIEQFFTTYPRLSESLILDAIRSVGHIFGHSGLNHVTGNLTMILLLGPMMEEKYGARDLMLMMAITAFVTAVLNLILLPTALHGASGIVFMLILLSSFSNHRQGTIPLTFVLLSLIYLGNEFLGVFEKDNVSQFAHILGGLCGGLFGYISGAKNTQ